MRFSRQDRGLGDLERALRTERPELDRSVQRDIIARISAHPARRSGGFRIVLAGVLTAGVFGAMAAFGGVSYATNSVQHSVGYSNNNKGWNYTPSCDQYGKGGKGGNGGYPPPINYGNKGGNNGYGSGFGGFGFGGFGW
ncbi:MAG TPA: hypothetical protein VGL44_00475 [Gaiellales bacterium]